MTDKDSRRERALHALASLKHNAGLLPDTRERAHLIVDIEAAAVEVQAIQELKRPRKAQAKKKKGGPLDLDSTTAPR